MEKENLKKKVAEKLNLAEDLQKKSNFEITNLKKIDDKYIATFSVSGYNPPKNKNPMMIYSKEYKKIFNDLDEFSEYAKKFFSLTKNDINFEE